MQGRVRKRCRQGSGRENETSANNGRMKVRQQQLIERSQEQASETRLGQLKDDVESKHQDRVGANSNRVASEIDFFCTVHPDIG